jgi:hypothetical protein
LFPVPLVNRYNEKWNVSSALHREGEGFVNVLDRDALSLELVAGLMKKSAEKAKKWDIIKWKALMTFKVTL